MAVQEEAWTLEWSLAVIGCALIFGWQLIVFSLYPINLKLMEAKPEDVPPEPEWRAMRRLWFERHSLRTLLSSAALVLFLLSALAL